MSACMSGTRGSGVLSSTCDVLVKGVGGVCDMCMCLARGGVYRSAESSYSHMDAFTQVIIYAFKDHCTLTLCCILINTSHTILFLGEICNYETGRV